jgi:hypothetical protein
LEKVERLGTTFFVKTLSDPLEVGECILEYTKDEELGQGSLFAMERSNTELMVFHKEDIELPKDQRKLVCIICQRAKFVMVEDVDNLLALNFAEPLLQKYGFENVKWLTVPDEKFVLNPALR